VKIVSLYARTEKGVLGYGCVFKAVFGPVSDKELGFCEEWRNTMKFVTFEEAEPSADFDEPHDDADADEGDDEQSMLLPPAEFETEADGAPVEPPPAAAPASRARRAHA
jgi:hypothetical protein